ncbi:MAG: LysR family transcriptional regulator [Paracoccaceae bacterium]
MTTPLAHRLRLRLVFEGAMMLGPGKAELLEGIRDTGSISAAGRQMAMSYKRAWSLVETLNAAFTDPLVESTRGGATGGGARLTKTGAQVLALYRQIEAKADAVAATEIAALGKMLRPPPVL